MLGNSDAHGKNFAILFAELGRQLAPLYDLVSTAIYGFESAMAMSVGDSFEPEQVNLTDWVDMSHDCDLGVDPFLAMVREMAARVRGCAEGVAQLSRAEGWHVSVIDEDCRGPHSPSQQTDRRPARLGCRVRWRLRPKPTRIATLR